MKKRKLVSLAATSALVASQLVTPVMAGTGTVTVPVDTQSVVIRVEVPTMIDVAVNEFESGDAGSQIYSTQFDMKNKSVVPVKVDVSSAVTLKSTGVQLVASADAVKNDGDVWLAVAAQTAAGNYGAAINELTSTSANVETFASDASKADQTFYLAAGTGSTVNKMLVADAEDVAAGVAAYGQIYALTLKDNTVFDGTDDDGALATLLAAGDVYTVAPADDKDEAVLTKVAEGEGYDNTKTYYAAATTAATSLTAASKYVYAEQATAGGAAAFRYIGKLSEEKTGGWSNTDITTVTISYDIQGVGTSVYDGRKDDCVYGLYTEPAAPSIASADLSKTLVAGTAIDFAVDLGAGSQKATKVASVSLKKDDTVADITKFVTVDPETKKLVLPAAAVDFLLADDAKYLPSKLLFTFNDADGTVVEVDLSK